MADKLEITLRVTLDRLGLEQRLKRTVENDTAFFVLGLVYAQLTAQYGDDYCNVEMDAATGIDPGLIRAMNSFARRHKRALEALDAYGETIVEDRDVLEVMQQLQDVVIVPVGSKWRIVRYTQGADLSCLEGSKLKN